MSDRVPDPLDVLKKAFILQEIPMMQRWLASMDDYIWRDEIDKAKECFEAVALIGKSIRETMNEIE